MTAEELWDFIPTDERLDEEVEVSSEEEAMSIVDSREPVTGLEYPDRRDVDVGESDREAPLALYADEDGAPEEPLDHEIDLVEILEAQHYVLG